MNQKNTFNAFLEEKIKENHLRTMEEVADKTGVSVSTISRIRAGKIMPSSGTMQQIAEAFGSTLEEALAVDPERVCVGVELLPTLLDNFNKVTEEQQKNYEALQSKLEMTLKLVEAKDEQIKHLTEENQRVVKTYNKTRVWAIACAVAFCTMLVVVIGILVYDLTHLDRGWFTAFFDRAVRAVAEVLK